MVVVKYVYKKVLVVMKIIVAGCGKIGKTIIESLVEEKHKIVAIDHNPKVVENITNTYDVMAVCGMATSLEILNEAGVAQADLFISVTHNDEVNMLACFLARSLGAEHTIARVRESNYNDEGLRFIAKQLNISVPLNPERLTAENLFNRLQLPVSVNVDTFAGKKVQLLETTLREGSKIVGMELAQIRSKSPVPFVACVVKRDDQVYIPTGTFVLQEGDKVAFMVKRNDANKFLKTIGLVQKQAHNVIILGASTIAYYLAKMLTDNNYGVKIIEKDPSRCTEISQLLPSSATIICGDGCSQEILLEEGIKTTDALVALTGRDEDNVLVALYAINQNVPKVIPKVNDSQKYALVEKLGMPTPVTAQKIVANVITRYARALHNTLGSAIETLYSLMDGDAEALEFSVLPDCALIGKKFKDLQIKPNFIVACIVRGKETIIPTGEDELKVGDKVVVISAGKRLVDLADMLR